MDLNLKFPFFHFTKSNLTRIGLFKLSCANYQRVRLKGLLIRELVFFFLPVIIVSPGANTTHSTECIVLNVRWNFNFYSNFKGFNFGEPSTPPSFKRRFENYKYCKCGKSEK